MAKRRLLGDVLNVEEGESGEGSIKETVRDYFPDLSGDAFQSLSKSDYAKVIFCDLYYNTDSTVGCRFQITDNVHEDPCDYIGLYKVGYDSLSQCLASKMLSQTECEDDGKLLRCTFKPTELPDLEHGFYQFLYVTRDQEVCGASMPFEIKNTIPKDFSSDEDIVADSTEDDFLVVRSHTAEKNRQLQLLLDEMNEKCLAHESEMKKIQAKVRIISEEKVKLEQLLKKACEEKMNLIEENHKLCEERNVLSSEKEEAVRILKEKNSVFTTIFDDFSCKLKGFTELKDTLEADKNLAIAENANLQERLRKLTEELQNKQKALEEEKERNQEMTNNLRKENSVLASQLDDARLMIEALEKSKQLSMTDLTYLSQTISEMKQKFKDMKCENYALKSKLQDTSTSLNKRDEQIHDMKSEITALKMHIIEMEESKPPKVKPSVVFDSLQQNAACKPVDIPIVIEDKCTSVQEMKQKFKDMKCENYALKSKLQDTTTSLNKRDEQIHDMKSEISALKLHITEMEESKPPKVQQNAACKPVDIPIIIEDKCTSVQEESVQTAAETYGDLLSLKAQWDELHAEVKEKNATIIKLKEDLVKSNAVVDYLTKERDSIQSNGSRTQEALNECVLRLNEASELYKKQYRKIEKLKKKLKRNKTDPSDPSELSSVKDLGSTSDAADDISEKSVNLPRNHTSDSDTGEHVVRHPLAFDKEKTASWLGYSNPSSVPSQVPSASKNESSASKAKEVPELETMIDENLEQLSSSKSKEEDEVLYAIPCPVCDQDVGIYLSSTEEMVKHLEMQHRQQLCPICGRLFDMTLPAKYFQFHVEDHFKKGFK